MKRFAFLFAAVALFVASQANAALLYTQPTNLNGAFASQNDTNGFGNFATVYDNFTLGTTNTITTATWVGSYFNPPAQGTITGWTLQFWADNAGQPGGSLFSLHVAGNASETFLGTDNFGDPTYTYSMALGAGFTATAGTQYWMSVVPDVGFPPQWGWEAGTGGDGIAVQDFFGGRSFLATDMAFSLFGGQTTTIPEPASLTLLGLGVMGLAGYTLRRRQKVSA